jgi:hypothetical protein
MKLLGFVGMIIAFVIVELAALVLILTLHPHR